MRSSGMMLTMGLLLMLGGCQTNRAPAPEPLLYFTLNDGTRIAGLQPVPEKEYYNNELLTDGKGEIYWPHDDPYERVSYAGDIQSAMPHGIGSMQWQDRAYEGAMKWGKPHGEGVMTFRDGRVLKGNWRYGFHASTGWHPHQLGFRGVKQTGNQLVWPDGAVYEGALRAGKPHGRGVMTWASGDAYNGDWQAGKRHGEGVQVNRDGSRYAGAWRNDRENGYGRAEFPNTLPGNVGGFYAADQDFQTTNGRKEYRPAKSETYTNYYMGEWADGMPTGRGERNWIMGQTPGYQHATLATGPFAPDADMLHHARTKWPRMLSIGGRRQILSYDGSWLDGDWHGPGIFLINDYALPTTFRSTFKQGWPDKYLEISMKGGTFYWSMGLDGRELHGDYVYHDDEYQWEWKYHQGEKISGTGHYLDGKKPKSMMPGLIAGVAMAAGVKSVGGDSSTALELALAFGTDVQNNTTHNTAQKLEQMEVRYQALKAENDARLKEMLDKAWAPSPAFREDGRPVTRSGSEESSTTTLSATQGTHSTPPALTTTTSTNTSGVAANQCTYIPDEEHASSKLAGCWQRPFREGSFCEYRYEPFIGSDACRTREQVAAVIEQRMRNVESLILGNLQTTAPVHSNRRGQKLCPANDASYSARAVFLGMACEEGKIPAGQGWARGLSCVGDFSYTCAPRGDTGADQGTVSR